MLGDAGVGGVGSDHDDRGERDRSVVDSFFVWAAVGSASLCSHLGGELLGPFDGIGGLGDPAAVQPVETVDADGGDLVLVAPRSGDRRSDECPLEAEDDVGIAFDGGGGELFEVDQEVAGFGGADDDQAGCEWVGVDRVGFHDSGCDVGSEPPGGQVPVAGNEARDRLAWLVEEELDAVSPGPGGDDGGER